MNPSNPFGSPQGGAFQAPNSAMKTGLFQSFGQQSSSNQSQTMGFFQPSAFGQPAALSQPAPHGNVIFGQTPSFGQPPAQPPSLPPTSQPPAFGQPTLGMSTSGFSSGTTPAFGQTSGPNQSTAFGQTPAFGQTSAFGQAPGFGQQTTGFSKQPPAFGQQRPVFRNSQMASGSTTTLGQPQPLSFRPSAFGQPSSTSVTTSVFGSAQSTTQSRAFGTAEFSFKPANEAVFKPIFSASPEPSNPQTTSMSSSPFGSQTSSSTASSTSTVFSPAKSVSLGFSFSQPAAAPSISVQNNPLTTGNISTPQNNPQFTFSHPAPPSNSSSTKTTTQPTTPSSFSFSAKTLQPQTAPLFGGASFGQPSAFGDVKGEAETNTDEKGSDLEAPGDTDIFGRFSKGIKRKEDTVVSRSGPEKPASEEDLQAEADSPRHPPKRPLTRTRGPTAGLISRALSGIRKGTSNPVKRETAKEQQEGQWEEKQSDDAQDQGDKLPADPPVEQGTTRDLLEKEEQSGET